MDQAIDEAEGAPAPVAPVEGAAPLPAFLSLGAAVTLAGCGGSGSGGSSSAPPPPVTVTPTPSAPAITAQQASRLLQQATFGATTAEIAAVQSLGYSGWIDDQIARPRTSHWDWLVANGYAATSFQNGSTGFDNSVWRQMITEPGQLRQRVGMALSEIFVIGVDGVSLSWRQFNGAAWLDVLLDNAFGNFRTLLERITYLPAMASWLTYLNNRRANATTGSVPDENYARELMQLFTLGLYRLNLDGSLVQGSGGQPVETYGQSDVSQLARVFTGMTLDSSDNTTPDRYRRALIFNNSIRESGASSFLGASVPAGTDGPGAVRIALDAIFNHPNTAPFIARQLIQRLVTSNPTPAYIQRVAQIFADNGQGTRGDLRAVVRAILLDSEARGEATLSQPNFGKLREPVIRLTNWARAFGATSSGGLWPIGNTSDASTRLAQSMGRSPSVFNFFRPGYAPPNTAFSSAGLVAPEFQITNELSVVGYVNYLQAAIQNGIGDVRSDYAEMLALAGDSGALVDRANLLLAAGQLSAATQGAIRAAVESIAATTTNGPIQRVYTAILLTMAAPDYLTQR